MIQYRKLLITKNNKLEIENQNYLKELISLSKSWVEEDICPSFIVNKDDDYIDNELYVALDNNKIIAYAKGEIVELIKETSYNVAGEKCFYLDEIYVNKSYRNQRIGKILYDFIEKDLSDNIKIIKVNAVSREYKKLLHFYIDELDMNFNNALLVKRLD